MSNPCTKISFVHLHVHSKYSFLDGASRVEALVRCAAEAGATALALTDHDNLCGAPEFMRFCRRHGIKPILGAELTLDGGRVIVLAKNRRGFTRSAGCSRKLISHTSAAGLAFPKTGFLMEARD